MHRWKTEIVRFLTSFCAGNAPSFIFNTTLLIAQNIANVTKTVNIPHVNKAHGIRKQTVYCVLDSFLKTIFSKAIFSNILTFFRNFYSVQHDLLSFGEIRIIQNQNRVNKLNNWAKNVTLIFKLMCDA